MLDDWGGFFPLSTYISINNLECVYCYVPHKQKHLKISHIFDAILVDFKQRLCNETRDKHLHFQNLNNFRLLKKWWEGLYTKTFWSTGYPKYQQKHNNNIGNYTASLVGRVDWPNQTKVWPVDTASLYKLLVLTDIDHVDLFNILHEAESNL